MRWLITGGSGMLGTDLARALETRGYEVYQVGHRALDITDGETVDRYVDEIRPAVIANCAAYTKVDDCESNVDLAMKINGWSVEQLADAADRNDSLLLQISTDFVFDGSTREPYEINAPVGPLSVYGRSKLEGEERARLTKSHVVLRTSWLFGASGWNFVEAIKKQIVSGKTTLRVVDDQVGSPTFTPHLATAAIAIAERVAEKSELGGTYHYSDAPACTWFDFASAIVEEMIAEGTAPADTRIDRTSSDEFPRPATRPPYSVLSTERYQHVTGLDPESWRDGLTEYFVEKRGES